MASRTVTGRLRDSATTWRTPDGTPPTSCSAWSRTTSPGLDVGASCEALLLTAKARVIAPSSVLRRGRRRLPAAHRAGASASAYARSSCASASRPRSRSSRRRTRRRSCSAPSPPTGIPTRDYGEPAAEVLDDEVAGEPVAGEGVRAAADPRRHAALGPELDDRVLPAEAGLVERAVSLTKGCYPGQEPIARLHSPRPREPGAARARDRHNRAAAYDAELRARRARSVGRVTSAVRDGNGVVALAYVAARSPTTPSSGSAPPGHGYTRQLPSAPVAQGIERCPAEAEVASSIFAGASPRSRTAPRLPVRGAPQRRGRRAPLVP